jgi:hypothetical protein
VDRRHAIIGGVVRLHRIVRTDPPTVDDFTSDVARGRPPRSAEPEAVRLASGLSVFATLAQARAKARQYPFLGAYVAVIELQEGGAVRWERTLPRSRGHHTVWDDPAELLDAVVAVVPV